MLHKLLTRSLTMALGGALALAGAALATSDGVSHDGGAPVEISTSLTDPASYAALRAPGGSRYVAPSTVHVPKGWPAGVPVGLPPSTDAATVRRLRLPADAPSSASAWAATSSDNGLCVLYQPAPDQPSGAACSGTGVQAPSMTFPNDPNNPDEGAVIVGLAPDGVETVQAFRPDGTAFTQGVENNVYFVSSSGPVSTVQLNVRTAQGVTQ